MKKEGAEIRPETERILQQQEIKKEIARLKKLYKNLGKDKIKIIDGLVEEAAFMKTTLLETRQKIIEDGTTEKFKQGKQEFVRKHPNLDVYTTLVSKYSTVMKQLIDFLPGQVQKTEADALAEFIRKGK